jgi:pyruvate dehydrogenase E2 component (dihydrolipoamide acetyltransferase)
MSEFRMPSLGADMTAGTLVSWLKKPGESLHRGDLIAEVDTDKGSIDVEVFTDGVLERCMVEPGQKVPVGTVLALIRDSGSPAAAPAAAAAPAPPTTKPVEPAAVLPGGGHRASPLARRMAEELHLDLARVQGTGPGGVITADDVRAASPAQTTAAAPAAQPEPAAGARMRSAIAAAMARSKREIPHYYLGTTIDLGRATDWLAAANAQRTVAERVLPAALLLKAVALAVRDFPELNAWYQDGRVVLKPSINLGVAIALRQGGLVAPALLEADRLPVVELMRKLTDLITRARGGQLRSSELAEGTLTVTSLGDQGAESVFGIIFPPQTALVGFGRIVERPWVVDGRVVPRLVLAATLSGDHRVSDGHRGGRFLAAIDHLLQEPDGL